MTKYVQQGGPCKRQCDVDKKTLICRSCGLYYGNVEEWWYEGYENGNYDLFK